MPNVRFKKDFSPYNGKNRDFLAILNQFLGFFPTFGLLFHNSIYISQKKMFSLKPVGIIIHYQVIYCVSSIIHIGDRDFLVFEIRKNLHLRKILVTPKIFLKSRFQCNRKLVGNTKRHRSMKIKIFYPQNICYRQNRIQDLCCAKKLLI